MAALRGGDATLVVVHPSSGYELVLESDLLEFKCRATRSIHSCRILINSLPTALVLEEDSKTKQYEYFGKGFRLGECGVRFQNARLVHSGNISCSVTFPDDGGAASAQSVIRVVKPPRGGQIRSANQNFEYMENETMHINCTADADEPDAFNVTLYLGILFFKFLYFDHSFD